MTLPSTFRQATLWLTLAGSALLAACGGGDDPAPSTTLSGTAAVGLPIAGGQVSVQCAGGAALGATTSTAGGWSITLSGQTLPCAVQVSGGTVGGTINATAYHAIALSIGTVNITPLTDLVMAQLLDSSPQAWFSAPTFTAIDDAAVASALNTIKTQLGLSTALGSANPLTTAFAANGSDTLDKLLEALANALGAAGQTYADLLAAAQANDYSAFTGFPTAFGTAWTALGGSGGGGTGGTGNLTVKVLIGGVATSSINITGVPTPANETEFCSDIQTDSALTGLTTGGGTLTVNSCSFSGGVGTVNATVKLTTPVSTSISYTVRYTYS